MAYDLKKMLNELKRVNDAAIDLALDAHEGAQSKIEELKPRFKTLKDKMKSFYRENIKTLWND